MPPPGLTSLAGRPHHAGMNRRSLALALSLLTAGCSGALAAARPSPGAECPPPARAEATPTTTLAAGGTGVVPREASALPAGTSTGASSTPRLVAGGLGVAPREVADDGRRATPPSTPHLVAGTPGGTPRVECPR
jgi:hypothetical protein